MKTERIAHPKDFLRICGCNLAPAKAEDKTIEINNTFIDKTGHLIGLFFQRFIEINDCAKDLTIQVIKIFFGLNDRALRFDDFDQAGAQLDAQERGTRISNE